jgi:ABC-2 type transport system permease protein
VYFPREVLPLASMGIPIVDFTFQVVVLGVFMLILRHSFWGLNLLLLPLAMFALLTFTASLALFVSAVNVRYRDTQHLVNVLLLIWFWFTPVVWPSGFLVREAVAGKELLGISFYHLMLANPMADIVMGFQRALYKVVTPAGADHPILLPVSLPWLAGMLALVSVGSMALLMLSWKGFFRRAGDFAEEL